MTDIVPVAGLIIIVGLIALGVFWKPRSTPIKAATSKVATATILVSGWSASELDKILEDFSEIYDLDSKTFGQPEELGTWRKVPLRGIDSDSLFYLVNYLHYPKEIELDGRRPMAVALFDIPRGLSSGNAPGVRSAKAYVPTNDEDYDLVYVAVEGGAVYRVPFTNLQWEATSEARMASDIRSLPYG